MPQFRTYAPSEDGVCRRVGRTYKTLAACLKVAATMSRNLDWVEIKDDARPINERLLAIARKGLILDSVQTLEIEEVLP